ncbi:MAG: hypothetical protein IPJ10_16255 [Flavobacteriales bacterium]|nr:hypothetical protein [Flavobacteriales bacterium]
MERSSLIILYSSGTPPTPDRLWAVPGQGPQGRWTVAINITAEVHHQTLQDVEGIVPRFLLPWTGVVGVGLKCSIQNVSLHPTPLATVAWELRSRGLPVNFDTMLRALSSNWNGTMRDNPKKTR